MKRLLGGTSVEDKSGNMGTSDPDRADLLLLEKWEEKLDMGANFLADRTPLLWRVLSFRGARE